MDLVRASAGGQGPGTGPVGHEPGGPGQDPAEETVYVETAEDLANVTVASVGQGGGPLHLTTITVAVPAPLSPSDVLQHAGHVVTTAPGHVTLPTVPVIAPPETAVRWKYEQNKQDSKHMNTHQTGSSLVSQMKKLEYAGKKNIKNIFCF